MGSGYRFQSVAGGSRGKDDLKKDGNDMNKTPYGVCAVALVILCTHLVGCSATSLVVGWPVFSPDGAQIACVLESRVEEIFPHGKKWFRTISLRWCKTDNPTEPSSTVVAVLGIDFAMRERVPIVVRWSPKGTHIGVLTPHKLLVICASSRKKTEVPDVRVTSFAWLSDSDIAYCARRKIKTKQKRVICRYDIGSGEIEEVVAFGGRPASKYFLPEHWAPSGQYVIFMEPSHHGRYHVVDVLQGKAHAFGQAGAHEKGVAWAPDSSQAFCVSNKTGPEEAYEAILLQPATGRTVDCTERYRKAFADNWPSLEPLWTADGRYVIANCLGGGGHLIQPTPWKVVPVGKALPPEVWPTAMPSQPRLYHLHVPGWLRTCYTSHVGNYRGMYAVNYSGSRIVRLPVANYQSLSPDGTMVAHVDPDGRIEVERLGEWWLPPSGESDESGPTSRPAPAARATEGKQK